MTRSEQFQRAGWNSYTIGLISKVGILIAGNGWLFFGSILESKVWGWEQIRAVKANSFRTGGVLLITAVFLFLLGYLI